MGFLGITLNLLIMKKLLLFTSMLVVFGLNAQVRLVRDLRPTATQSSSPTSLFVYNGRLFFSATYSNGSRYVFSTDGTGTGTDYVRINDAISGTPAMNTFGSVLFCEYNNELFFDAKSGSTANVNIMKLTSATGAATSVFDLTNLTTTNQSRFVGAKGINNKLVFSPLVATQVEPVVIDLQIPGNSGYLYDINPGASNVSTPLEFTVLGTNCFFAASNPTSGRELWKTDGTNAGTSLYLDVFSGSGTSNPNQLNVLGTQLTFAATHSSLGRELFKTNGSGSLTLLKDINTAGDSNPSSCTVIDGLEYFGANNGATGQELWVTAGTTLSTYLVADLFPGVTDSNPSQFTKAANTVFFVATSPLGAELWKTDGTLAGTVLVKDIYSGAQGSSPANLIEYNGKLYFTADNGTDGTELWVSDGTDAGTVMAANIFPGATGSAILGLTVFNNELFFGATASSTIGQELYAYMDPTLAVNHFDFDDNAVALFPNPAFNYFEISSKAAIDKVEVYSLLGQLVKVFHGDKQYSVSDLSKGSYMIRIHTANGVVGKALIVE